MLFEIIAFLENLWWAKPTLRTDDPRRVGHRMNLAQVIHQRWAAAAGLNVPKLPLVACPKRACCSGVSVVQSGVRPPDANVLPTMLFPIPTSMPLAPLLVWETAPTTGRRRGSAG